MEIHTRHIVWSSQNVCNSSEGDYVSTIKTDVGGEKLKAVTN